MTGGDEWGSKENIEGICFLGWALNQGMNTMEFVLGKSTEREVDVLGLEWGVVVVYAWLVPSFHSSDDC